ncbi:MAG: outer membrane beta-barrel protein [Acidobacteriota bacterium]|nr:outer membrane beta-barrel protein [Acidobacteriota bacterium]
MKLLMQRMRLGVVLALAVLGAGLLAGARAQAQFSVYGQATGASLRGTNIAHVYGATFGMFDQIPVGRVLIGADFRGALMTRPSLHDPYNDQAMDIGQFGLRVAGGPGLVGGLRNLQPYLEGSFGLGYWRGGVSPLRQDGNHFLLQAIAGADYKLRQNVSWRVAEITYGRLGAVPGFLHPITVSTGVVFRFQ